MSHINRKYIDSHWVIFVLKGIVSLLFGGYALFATNHDRLTMVTLAGLFLLILSIIEFINAIYRASQKTGWAVSVSIAVIDAVVALALLFTRDQNVEWHLIMVAAYTIFRGIFELISGFRATIDPTDRFTWIFGGMCGAIMGFAILNSANFFFSFFGAYLLILGTCSLFYGVHNRAQKLEDKVARKEAAALAARTRKKNAKKSANRSK